MTAPAQYAESTVSTTPPAGPSRGRLAYRWQPWALAAICVLAAALYGWGIWVAGDWGNTFYTAAVKSMSENFTNFLFGSFDPAGVVTVDKPPMALWPQVFAVWIFGFHSWAIALPQVLEGVAAVFLLHRAVRRWFGEHVALLAALILTLTPITVAINHVNNPDALLVLWSVAAAYALTRAMAEDVTPRGRTGWLVLCAVLLGCGFVTKMLAAWIVVPGFAVAFLMAARGRWPRRLIDLGAATGALLVSSFWWPLLHDWWPGAKPYMDNSTDGTALNLIFGYNGLNRIVGNDTPAGAPRGIRSGGGFELPRNIEDEIARLAPRGGAGGNPFGGGTGIGRMFSASVGGQISWLIPFALLAIAVVAAAGIIRWRRTAPARPAWRGGWMLWGSWLVVTFVVFSFAQGIWHPYYTTMLAPPIAALAAAGLAELWRYHRNPTGPSWLLLPFGVVITAVWAYVLVERDPAWHGWAGPAVLVVGALAVVGLVVAKLGIRATLRPARIGLALAAVAVLLVPGVWSTATAFAGERTGGVMASAGPPVGGFGGAFGGGGGRRPTGGRGGFGGPGGPGGRGGAGGPGGFGGMDQGTLTAQQRAILDYAVANAPDAQIKLAIEGSSSQAAPFIIGSNQTVIGMGGFMGADNAPSVDQLRTWVAQGRLRFVLGTSAGGGFGGRAGGFGGMFGGSGNYSQARDSWVTANCTVVPPSAYGGSADGSGGGQPGFFGAGNQTLYRCGG